MRSKTILLAILVALMVLPLSANAGQQIDFPDWWVWPPGPPDGQTREQYHSFQTDPNLNLPPDWTYDGFLPSVADFWQVPAAAMYNQPTGYMANLFTTAGAPLVDLADGLGLYIPNPDEFYKDMANLADDNNLKEFFGCVIWIGPAGATLDITVDAPGTVDVNQFDVIEPTMAQWRCTVFEGTIWPQPDMERFNFNFVGFQGTPEPSSEGIFVDTIYVGTHCVPEPGMLVLLVGLVGLVGLIRRK